MDAIIRKLTPEDAEAFVALRHEMLTDNPLAFGSSPEDDRVGDVGKVREILGGGAHHVIFGAFAPDLAGCVGVACASQRKAAHIAMVWGMYVSPRQRRKGIARRLLDSAIAHARTQEGVRQVQLGVSDVTPGARALYEAAGFVRWGTEPRATQYEGRFVDEHHLVLRLDAAP